MEDADDMREAMQAMLEELGARVVGAGNGEEALDRLRPEEIDAVLCDLRMPQMDGYEFVSVPELLGIPPYLRAWHGEQARPRALPIADKPAP